MLGTFTNVGAIAAGALVGVLMKKGISESVKCTVMQGLGLAILLVGAQMALQTKNILIVIISLVIGGTIGELLKLKATWPGWARGWKVRLVVVAGILPGPLLPQA